MKSPCNYIELFDQIEQDIKTKLPDKSRQLIQEFVGYRHVELKERDRKEHKMIHKVKVTTWEVRSHGIITTITDDGAKGFTIPGDIPWSKGNIERAIRHMQDVLKCMRQIEREKQARKERQANEDLPDEK